MSKDLITPGKVRNALQALAEWHDQQCTKQLHGGPLKVPAVLWSQAAIVCYDGVNAISELMDINNGLRRQNAQRRRELRFLRKSLKVNCPRCNPIA